MVDPDRRPTAQEIEELIDLVRRDPASPAFIDLGEAYLALGRPRDALGVGNVGLDAAPGNLEGRVMLARAYAALHQWKEAQGELLRVVKVDRANRQGFALLGEVLLRRQDFERAVPVLQHAQNLDPTSPQILSMLKRARAGQPLEPPPPLPVPVPPRGASDNGDAFRGRRRAGPSPAPRSRPPMPPPAPMLPPTPMAAPMHLGGEPMHDWRNEPATEHAPPPSFADASAGIASPPAPPPAPTHAGAWPAAPAGGSSPAGSPAWHSPSPSPPVPTPPPLAAPAGPSRTPKHMAPPPASVEGVRPRIVQSSKPQNAAAASLRQSAAVGETYLNDLLTGGLLDVAGVRVPDADFDLRPDRRWGRSTRRAFIFLFVVLVLGIGGGGTWYWWTEKQKAEAVARLQKESQLAIPLGDYQGFEGCLKKLGEALEKDKTSLITYGYFAECAGLESLLYGTDADRVDGSLKVANQIKPDEPGAREVLIGKSALELSRLGVGDGTQSAVAQVAKSTLAEVRKSLDAFAAKHDKDKWVAWLRGRAMLAGGERQGGRAMIKSAADGDDGLLVAMIDSADLLVDDGQLDEAMALYDKAAAKAKDHPLVVVGRSLGRAEASVQNEETIGELSVKLAKELPSRLSSYRHLAVALANLGIESYPSAKASLNSAVAQHPPNEPRFWARVAWAHYARGDLANASAARARIVWFGQGKAEDDPSVKLVDAALSLASGLPEKALDVAAKLQGVRPQLLRAYAYLDLGKPKDALKEASDVLKRAPENVEAQILLQQARMVGSEGKERTEATDALEKLARKVKSKIGRHALGIAHKTNGNLKEAQTQLEQATQDISDESPNPLVYRTRTALAEILLDNGDIAGAGKQLDEALKVNSGYFPTRALQAKVVLRNGEPERALDMLKPVFDEIGVVPPALRLLYAEARGTQKKATAADKESAVAVLKDIRDQVPAPELSRVAAAIDPKLPRELGLPEPPAAEAPKSQGDRRRRR
ncbi:MAG TPA: tetratricopeptide repeat protein [Kofleriaceae bacterium]|nr:tetratricopeptide repeat protein [Kofleriaceae bacterium]